MQLERSYLLIKPDVFVNGGRQRARDRLAENGVSVIGSDVFRPNFDQIKLLYPDRMGTEYEKDILDYMTLGEIEILHVEADNQVFDRVLKTKGKTGSSGLRASDSRNYIWNSYHCPDGPNEYKKEIEQWNGTLRSLGKREIWV
jgi:nucleoside diphosphate kinase